MNDFNVPNNGDIGQDTKAELSKFSQKLKEKAAIASPSDTPAPQNTQGPQSAALAASVTPASAAPTQDQPVAVPALAAAALADPAKELSTEPPAPTEEVAEAWDKDLIAEAPKEDKPFTIENLSSALKLDGIKTKDDLVAKFTGLETKIKELEVAKEQAFEGFDDDLKEVLKVAQSKGDWKAFLSTRVIDYSRVDPVKLFENSVEQNPRFRKADGSIDFDAVDASLAEVPLAVKESQGNMLRQQLMDQQTQRRNQIYIDAQRRQTEYNTKLAEASRNIPGILSRDKVGIALEPKHSDFLYEGVRSGKLVEKHLGKIDVSGIAPDKLLRTLALAEWGENISRHQLAQGIVQGKKQLLMQAQNVQLNTPAIPPQPNQPDAKAQSPADRIKAQVERYVTKGSL